MQLAAKRLKREVLALHYAIQVCLPAFLTNAACWQLAKMHADAGPRCAVASDWHISTC